MITKNDKGKSLERGRPLFFTTGLLIAASLVLVAFEWTTFRTERLITLNDDEFDEITEILVMPNFEIQEMEKPKVNSPKTQHEKEVKNEFEIDEEDGEKDDPKDDFNFDDGDDDEGIDPSFIGTGYKPWIDTVFTIVEKMPEFPGGPKAFNKFLMENLKYPKMEQVTHIEGTVYVSFIVDTDGKITDIEILRAPSPGLAKEAERVIKMMPKWIPGEQRGNKVRVKFNQPLKFTLSK
jgi:protein TonB